MKGAEGRGHPNKMSQPSRVTAFTLWSFAACLPTYCDWKSRLSNQLEGDVLCGYGRRYLDVREELQLLIPILHPLPWSEKELPWVANSSSKVKLSPPTLWHCCQGRWLSQREPRYCLFNASLYTQQTVLPRPQQEEENLTLKEPVSRSHGKPSRRNPFVPKDPPCPNCSPTHLTLPMPISLSQTSSHLFLKEGTPLWCSSHHQELENKLCLYRKNTMLSRSAWQTGVPKWWKDSWRVLRCFGECLWADHTPWQLLSKLWRFNHVFYKGLTFYN